MSDDNVVTVVLQKQQIKMFFNFLFNFHYSRETTTSNLSFKMNKHSTFLMLPVLCLVVVSIEESEIKSHLSAPLAKKPE